MKKSILFVFTAFVLLPSVACGMEQQGGKSCNCLYTLLSTLPGIKPEDAASDNFFSRDDFIDLFKKSLESDYFNKMINHPGPASFHKLLINQQFTDFSRIIVDSLLEENYRNYMLSIGRALTILTEKMNDEPFLKQLFDRFTMIMASYESRHCGIGRNCSIQTYFNRGKNVTNILKMFISNKLVPKRSEVLTYICSFETALLNTKINCRHDDIKTIRNQKLAWVKELREAANLLKTPFPEKLGCPKNAPMPS